ncbi:ferrochelatase [Bradyrhizobium sp. USDA 3364]
MTILHSDAGGRTSPRKIGVLLSNPSTPGGTDRVPARSIRAGLLGNTSCDVVVECGMRYGNPSLKAAIERLEAKGCDRTLFVPLYPQYSAATSATACDKPFEVLASVRHQSALRIAAPYFEEAAYIDAIADSVTEDLLSAALEPDVIVASFHGMPLDTRLMQPRCAEHSATITGIAQPS